MHSYPSPKVGNKKTRGLVGCSEMGILEIEPEKRRVGKGPSELNADRWSAVMSGGEAELSWQIESSLLRHTHIGSNRQQVPPIVTRPAGLQSMGCNRLGHENLAFAQELRT